VKRPELNQLMKSFSDCFLWCVGDPPLYCFGQTSENDYEEGGKNLKMKNLQFTPPLLLGAAAMFGIAVTSSLAQELPEKLPTKADLAKDNKLFAELATKYLHWDEPTDPIHIVGPLDFVGTRGLSSWLFVTSEGNILLNTGTTLPQKGMQSGWVVQKQ
jgi:hypothetical protein